MVNISKTSPATKHESCLFTARVQLIANSNEFVCGAHDDNNFKSVYARQLCISISSCLATLAATGYQWPGIKMAVLTTARWLGFAYLSLGYHDGQKNYSSKTHHSLSLSHQTWVGKKKTLGVKNNISIFPGVWAWYWPHKTITRKMGVTVYQWGPSTVTGRLILKVLVVFIVKDFHVVVQSVLGKPSSDPKAFIHISIWKSLLPS